MRVVPFCGGGRDLALQYESWKVVTIDETNILRGYIKKIRTLETIARLETIQELLEKEKLLYVYIYI
jgi:hypothetical protein